MSRRARITGITTGQDGSYLARNPVMDHLPHAPVPPLPASIERRRTDG